MAAERFGDGLSSQSTEKAKQAMRCVKEATRGLCGHIYPKGLGHGTQALPMVDVAHHRVHGLARTKRRRKLAEEKERLRAALWRHLMRVST